jgi:peptidoglycan-N-acetylglucosamine deacetylase
MRLFRPGYLAVCLYPDALFRIKTKEKLLFLTLDDGPDPLSTPLLLDILKKYNVGALFFCTGRNAEKYPALMDKIRSDGHSLGNHSYSHPDGWKTDPVLYENDINKASAFTSDRFLRPPYGRLTLTQKKLLKSYRIVFWDLMPYDFDITFSAQKCLKVLKNNIRPGSIIVLHDSSLSCASIILEDFLKFAINAGYRFAMIDSYALLH